ncbi:MAG: hypothetical protein N2645_21970 [Clostridia bacterium]|nr:hypothetical protein [Clostridia bacterium]
MSSEPSNAKNPPSRKAPEIISTFKDDGETFQMLMEQIFQQFLNK